MIVSADESQEICHYVNSDGIGIELNVLRHHPTVCQEFIVKSPKFNLCRWLLYTGLLHAGGWAFQLHIQDVCLLLTVLFCISVVLLVKVSFKVHKESFLIMSSVGVQLTTTYVTGHQTSRFYDMRDIEAVIINEAITRHQVVYYLAVLLRQQTTQEYHRRLVPVFLPITRRVQRVANLSNKILLRPCMVNSVVELETGIHEDSRSRIMTDCQTVDLDLSAMTASLHSAKANFEHVVFRDVAETYIVGNDIRLTYNLGEELEASSRDWVGLYQVGWRSTDNYKCFEWSPLPSSYVVGKASEGVVVFPASKLPKDDGEFYQFCYVTSKGHVRGASPPFQFRKLVKSSSIDDLIEIEDENGELLIVKSKTVYLDEQLKKVNERCCQLKQDIELLGAEKDLILLGKQELNTQVTSLTEEIVDYKKQLSAAKKYTAKLTNEVSLLQFNISQLKEKLDIVNLEKVEADRKLIEVQKVVEELQKTNRVVVNEKDTLHGRIKSLEDEKALYQKNFISSESAAQAHLRQVEELHNKIENSQATIQKLGCQLEEQETKLQQQVIMIEEMNVEQSRNKEMLAMMETRLSETTLELSAKEKRELELKDEVNAANEMHQKLSADLEKVKSETEFFKSQVDNSKLELLREQQGHEQQLADITKLLTDVTKEKHNLIEEVTDLRHQLEEAAVHAGADVALFALQSAQETLKERYKQLERHAELQQSFKDQSTVKIFELKEELSRQQTEIRDLKARLLMGQEEYKAKYVEVLSLQDALKKLKKNEDKRGPTNVIATEAENVGSRSQHSKISHLKESCTVSSVSGAASESSSMEPELELTPITDAILTALGEVPPTEQDFRSMEVATLELQKLPKPLLEMLISKLYKQVKPKDAVKAPSADVLAAALTPLPAPLVPQRIYPELNQVNEPVTSTTTVSASTDGRPDWIAIEDEHSLPNAAGFIMVNNSSITSTGGILTVCPVAECGLQFPANSSEEFITAHVDMHFVGDICPMCSQKFPRNSKDYAPHVQSHFC